MSNTLKESEKRKIISSSGRFQIHTEPSIMLEALENQAVAIFRMASDSYYTEAVQLQSVQAMALCLAQAIRYYSKTHINKL